MTSYSRSAYGSNPLAGTNVNGARSRGWGSGWPNCQGSRMKTVAGGDIRVTVRTEIAEMVSYLLNATDKLYNLKSGQTGAYNCRPIAGTNTASNHSWGLAIDINWEDNPMSTNFHSEIPPAVVKMWNACGFYWGGFYNNRYDTMHFEYVGSPSDVARHTAKAGAYAMGETPAPKPVPVTPSTPAGEFGAEMTDKSKIGDRVVKIWSRGVDVSLVQRYLGMKDDGYFGKGTEDRVKAWQMSQDLKADGVVGDASWKVIKRNVSGI